MDGQGVMTGLVQGITCDCGEDDEVLAKVKIGVWRDNRKCCLR